jgi:hypothetical protein
LQNRSYYVENDYPSQSWFGFDEKRNYSKEMELERFLISLKLLIGSNA